MYIDAFWCGSKQAKLPKPAAWPVKCEGLWLSAASHLNVGQLRREPLAGTGGLPWPFAMMNSEMQKYPPWIITLGTKIKIEAYWDSYWKILTSLSLSLARNLPVAEFRFGPLFRHLWPQSLNSWLNRRAWKQLERQLNPSQQLSSKNPA